MTVIVIGLGIALVLGLAVGLPFASRRRSSYATTGDKLSEQLQQAVNAVRDLDLDFDMGKIAEADYTTQRKLLIGRGVSTLIHYDGSRQPDDLEAQISAYRQNKPSKVAG